MKAAQLAAAGQFGQMVALKGNEVVPVSLKEATAKLKTVTPEWLALLDMLTGGAQVYKVPASFSGFGLAAPLTLVCRLIAMLLWRLRVALSLALKVHPLPSSIPQYFAATHEAFLPG